MKSKLMLVLLMSLLFISVARAATIHGAVYDGTLELVENVQLGINTTPKQIHVSKNGLYFFNVPPGTYTIIAEKFYQKQLAYTAVKIIQIDKDGEFNIDIVVEQIEGVEIPSQREVMGPSIIAIWRAKYGWLFYLGIFLMGALLLTGGFYISKPIFSMWHREKRETTETNGVETSFSVNVQEEVAHHKVDEGEEGKEESSEQGEEPSEQVLDLTSMLNFIKSEDGRTTQKDIRKKFPLSEAKISLMISELESKGRIEKIKKGRGNIVILKEEKKEGEFNP